MKRELNVSDGPTGAAPSPRALVTGGMVVALLTAFQINFILQRTREEARVSRVDYPRPIATARATRSPGIDRSADERALEPRPRGFLPTASLDPAKLVHAYVLEGGELQPPALFATPDPFGLIVNNYGSTSRRLTVAGPGISKQLTLRAKEKNRATLELPAGVYTVTVEGGRTGTLTIQ